MKRMNRWRRLGAMPMFAAAFCAVATPPVWGQGATRDLPDYYIPGVTLTVTIAIDAPPGSGAVALQDAPPAGWVTSSISNGGTRNGSTEPVKWGPYFEPSIPATVSYDVTPASGSSAAGKIGGQACFDGLISFVDTDDQPIGGELCIPFPIPTLSAWGMLALTAVLLTAGMLILSRRRVAG